MDKKISWALIIAGSLAYFFPQWQGMFVDTSDISTGEARIVATIMFVGGLLLLHMPTRKDLG